MTEASSEEKKAGDPTVVENTRSNGPATHGGIGAERRVRLDTSRMKSSYCNVCNATSTQEEVVLNLGLNQSWDRPDGDIDIAIQHRVIMSPHAAKKLHGMIGKLLDEYQQRYGVLK